MTQKKEKTMAAVAWRNVADKEEIVKVLNRPDILIHAPADIHGNIGQMIKWAVTTLPELLKIKDMHQTKVVLDIDDSLFDRIKTFIKSFENETNPSVNYTNKDSVEDLEVVEASTEKNTNQPNNTPFSDIRDFLSACGLPLNVICDGIYISDEGQINTVINGKSLWKDLTDEEFIHLRRFNYSQREQYKRDLLIKYFGKEIMAAASENPPSKVDYTQYVVPDNMEIKSAEVFVNEHHHCTISGFVNGEHKEYSLDYADILAFFEVNEKGERTFRVLPENLMVKYYQKYDFLPEDNETVIPEEFNHEDISTLPDSDEGVTSEPDQEIRRRGFHR